MDEGALASVLNTISYDTASVFTAMIKFIRHMRQKYKNMQYRIYNT